MNYTIEQQIIASRPITNAGNEVFVAKTMQAVQAADTYEQFGAAITAAKAGKARRLLMWYKQLPVVLAIVVALAVTGLLGGVVYAAVRYIPALLTITTTTTTPRGTTEYTIPGFVGCRTNATVQPQKFEVKKDASGLSASDVQKIVVARCEEDSIDPFVTKAWPTYGTNKRWQDGDAIYYARPDVIGSLKSASITTVTLNPTSSGERTKAYKVQSGQKITAYANGVTVPFSSLKPDDTVYVISRVSEIYHSPPKYTGSYTGGVQYVTGANPDRRVVGAIGLVKLSEPLKYYGALQNDITEIPPCLGNPTEFCPGTAGIDIFPRVVGEGATNPSLMVPSSTDTNREISGTVKALGSNTMTLQASSGKLYMVTAPQNAFSDYNTNYAPQYDGDATLQIGSTASVRYTQPAGSSPQTITPNQIQVVELLIDGSNAKQDDIKKY